MGIVFDALDNVMERLRQRHLSAILITGLVTWLAGAGLVGYGLSGGSDSWLELALYLALPLGLIGATAAWGLGGLEWPLWPIGVTPVVFAGGFFVPYLDRKYPVVHLTPELPLALLLFVLGYVYVQVFLGVLVSIHEYRKRRRAARGRADHPDSDRRAQRRVLQVKLLLAITIMAVDITGFSPEPNNPRLGGWAAGFVVALYLCGIAIFVRQAWTAWSAAGLLGLTTVAYAASALARHQPSDLAGTGWVGLLGAYLFAKAARRDYWPLGRTSIVPPDPAALYGVPGAPGRATIGPTSALGVTSLAVSTCAAVGCCCGGQIAESVRSTSWQIGVAAVAGMVGLIGAVSGHLALGRISRRGLSGSGVARTGLAVGWIVAVLGLLYALQL